MVYQAVAAQFRRGPSAVSKRHKNDRYAGVSGCFNVGLAIADIESAFRRGAQRARNFVVVATVRFVEWQGRLSEAGVEISVQLQGLQHLEC